MPAAFEMGNVMTSRQGVPPGTESPQLISKLQDAGLTGGSREGKIIPNRENDCEVELISCIICFKNTQIFPCRQHKPILRIKHFNLVT